jgi:hypothetical protein
MNSSIYKVLAVSLLLMLIENYTYAQGGHYWAENFGNKSMLLSGTVNASVSDLGAVYYNPGRLGQIENPAFIINAQVYEWETVKIEDGINEGVDLNQSKFGGVPSLLAGTFKLPFAENHHFAYSFLTRQRNEVDFFVRVEDEGDIIESMPGNEIFNGSLRYRTKFTEEWLGLTWSYPLNDKLSIGLSNFISVVSKSNGLYLNMNTLGEENNVATLNMNREYSYNNYGLIWKAGLAYKMSRLNFGVTITTPRINIYGKGSTLYENFLSGVDTTGNGQNDDVFVYDLQKDLEVTYRHPWAVGMGIGVQFKKAILHLSAEWFDKVPRYTIIETEPFVGQSTGDTLKFSLVEELNWVINFGLGLEYYLSEKVSLFASGATDFSAVTSNTNSFAEFENQVSNSVIEADFLQFGGGISIETRKVDITVGATYSGADEQFDRPIDFPSAEDNIGVFDSGETSRIRMRQWKFIIGFSFPFADKMRNNLE